MRETLLKRRSEMLNMVALGIPLAEMVETLAKKYKVSTVAIYIDHKKMHMWAAYVSTLADGRAVIWVVVNALRRLVPRAWQSYTKAQTSAERIGAIREMHSIYMDIMRVLINTGKIKATTPKLDIEDVTPFLDLKEWNKLPEDEQYAITEAARLVIKNRVKTRSESLH